MEREFGYVGLFTEDVVKKGCFMQSKKEKNRKLFYWIVIIGIIISFIPLLYICKYNCPSADDYNYAVTTVKVWNQTHSMAEVLKEAVNTSIRFWHNWQGLYVSAFLLAFQPAIFGLQWYALTGIIMLLLIVGSTLFFSSYFVHRLFNMEIMDGITIGFVLSFFMIQFMPSAVEGLYWFNGAVNYGFFFAALLLYICLLIELQRQISKPKEIILFLGCLLSVFILEGGNHVTALMGVVFTAAVLINNCKSNRHKTLLNLVLVCCALGFLYINLGSPGTAIRYDRFNENTEPYGIIDTVIAATVEGIGSVCQWIGFKEIVMVALLFPILTKMTAHIRKENNFQFKYPLAVLIASVAWICIMYCPPYLGMRAAGQGRLINLVYYSFEILFLINVIYILGWIQGIIKAEYIEKLSAFSWKHIITVAVLAVAIVISSVKMTWTYRSCAEIIKGEAKQYQKELIERDELIRNSEDRNLIVPSLSVHPKVIYFDDITNDPLDWRNSGVAKYYGVDSIATE